MTFEAFNCLSLPLPIKLTKPVSVTVLLLAPEEAPIKIVVDVEPTLTVSNIHALLHFLFDLVLIYSLARAVLYSIRFARRFFYR